MPIAVVNRQRRTRIQYTLRDQQRASSWHNKHPTQATIQMNLYTSVKALRSVASPWFQLTPRSGRRQNTREQPHLLIERMPSGSLRWQRPYTKHKNRRKPWSRSYSNN